MNYHLYNYSRFVHDTKWLSFFAKSNYEKDPRLQTVLSRTEDYYEYKGLNRTKDYSIKDRTDYARIYLRADNKNIEIKRHYQDIMEFYADNSILLDLINFFCIIFSFINEYLSYNSIMNKIFYFEKDEEKFKCFEDFKEIPKYKEFPNFTISNNKNNDISIYGKDDKGETENKFKLENIETTEAIVEIKNRYKRYEISNCNRFSNWIFFCYKRKYPHNPIDIIDKNLDVVFYLKNMLLSRLINKINYEDKQSFMNFLSVLPIIHKERGNEDDNISVEEKEEELYQNTEKLYIHRFSKVINSLKKKEKLKEKDAKMIKLFKKRIKE